MNALRRSFLKLLGAAGAAAVTPGPALADRIRILPDGGGPVDPGLPGQVSPDLQRTLGQLTVGPGVTQAGLSVLWLIGGDSKGSAALPAALEVLTLDEARARGALTVVERAQASVPDLIAENRGKAHVLLLAGEILIGGKQNRVLREDLLLPPLSGPRNVSVYCVEQGRWNEGRKDFESRSSVVQPSVRSEVLRKAEQGRIWSGVAAASRNLQAASPTGSYQAVYDAPEVKAHLDRATRSLEAVPLPGVGRRRGLRGPEPGRSGRVPRRRALRPRVAQAAARLRARRLPGRPERLGRSGGAKPRGGPAARGRARGGHPARERGGRTGSSSSPSTSIAAPRSSSRGRRCTWRSCERRLDRPRARAMMRPHAEPRAGPSPPLSPARRRTAPMAARLPYLDRAQVAPEIQSVFDTLQRAAGACSTSSGSWPTTRGPCRRSIAWYPRLREGPLDLKLRYLAYVRASQLNRCRYCVTHNGAAGRRVGDPEGAARGAGRPSHEPALLRARAAGDQLCGGHDHRGPGGRALVETLRQRLGPEALVQLTLTMAAANFTNRFNEALGTELEREEARDG